MDLAENLQIILTYLEQLNTFNGNIVELLKFQKQRNNIDDLKLALNCFQTQKESLSSVEELNTKDTQEKLKMISEFIESLSNHILIIQKFIIEMLKID